MDLFGHLYYKILYIWKSNPNIGHYFSVWMLELATEILNFIFIKDIITVPCEITVIFILFISLSF